MKQRSRKHVALLLVLSLVLSLGAALPPLGGTGAAKAAEAALADSADDTAQAAESTFQDLNQQEIVEAMGAGWNLGNQMEATDGTGTPKEDAWTQVKVTERLIRTVKQQGFKTIRIPVSYLSMIGEAPDYTIDSTWLSRVQEIVDWAVKYDLYVVMNIHGDGYSSVKGGWILPRAENQEAIREKFAAVWQQIAGRFKDYDQHIIFESMNEIGANVAEMNDGAAKDAAIAEAYENINAYNQIFVDIVRQSGGNNGRRWLLVPGLNTDVGYTTGDYGFKIPGDSHLDSRVPEGQKRLMISVHYYNPWAFCGQEDYTTTQWGEDADPGKKVGYGQEDDMQGKFQTLKETFTDKGYPVIIGEYGSIDKSTKNNSGAGKAGEADPDNNTFRAAYASLLCRFASENGCVPVYWDNGWNGDFGFGLIDRKTYKVTQPGIIEAIINAYAGKQGTATAITLDRKTIETDLAAGNQTLQASLTPADANDIIQWESSDTGVAQVSYKGVVTPKGTGTCLITATVPGGASACCIVKVKEPTGFKAGLYAQSAHDWNTLECADYLEITGDGTGSYAISLTGTKDQMSKLATLFIKDVTVQREVAKKSVLGSAQFTVDSVKFNGHECTLTTKDFYYEELFDTNTNKDTVPDICMLNYWYAPANCISDLTRNPGKEQGYSFPSDWYVDGTNTLTMEVTVKDAVLKKQTTVQEEVPAESLSLSSESLSLKPGSSQALTATVLPAAATEKVLWYSENQKTAMVSQNGTVTAAGEGETVIHALTYSGKDASCQIKVQGNAGGDPDDNPSAPPSTSPSIEPSTNPSASPSIEPGTSPDVKPSAAPGGNQTPQPGGNQNRILAKGTVFTADKLKYKVTGATKGKTTVAVKAPESKKAASLTIPATVKKNGVSYSVTSVGDGAFKNCKKLKKVTIGMNVTAIGKNAFSGAKALKKITVKTTKLKKIGKNALKGIHKKAVIKVPKKKLKAYRKLWKKKGQKNTVKVK